MPTHLATTRWDLVRSAAEPEGHAARDDLARLYWFPLYAFARTRGASAEDAADAVQTFLARLLDRNILSRVTVEGGRFRDFLRVSLGRQLISQHRAESTARRRPEGGFAFPDAIDPEARFALEPADGRTPERAYDRLCAHALLDAARDRLRREYEAAGRGALFDHLAAHLDEDPEALPHADAARRLGIAPGTVRNEAVRLRRRFHDVLRATIASTLTDPGRLEEELRHLVDAVRR